MEAGPYFWSHKENNMGHVQIIPAFGKMLFGIVGFGLEKKLAVHLASMNL